MYSSVKWIAAFLLYRGHGQIDTMPAIVNGNPVDGGTYPWMVSLVLYVAGMYQQGCGGSLIQREPLVILTAAHCVDESRIREKDGSLEVNVPMFEVDLWLTVRVYAQFGRTNTNTNAMRDHQLSVEITSSEVFHIHPLWNGDTRYGNDIALIKIGFKDRGERNPLPIDYPVISLPSAQAPDTGCCYDHEPLDVLGYGQNEEGDMFTTPMTDTLEHISMIYHTPKECQEMFWDFYCKLGLEPTYCNSTWKEEDAFYDMICVSGDNVDTCTRDSGGPLFRKLDDGRTELLGIGSFGSGWCNPKDPEEGHTTHVVPSVFTSVPHCIGFIERFVREDQKDGDLYGKNNSDGFWSSRNIAIIAGVSVAAAIAVIVLTVWWYRSSKRARSSAQRRDEVEGYSTDDESYEDTIPKEQGRHSRPRPVEMKKLKE